MSTRAKARYMTGDTGQIAKTNVLERKWVSTALFWFNLVVQATCTLTMKHMNTYRVRGMSMEKMANNMSSHR